MFGVPATWKHTNCIKCAREIVWVQTPRKSKGKPVEDVIDRESSDNGTVVVSLVGGILHGGPVAKSKAAAMRAAGQPLYTLHAETCLKRNTNTK